MEILSEAAVEGWAKLGAARRGARLFWDSVNPLARLGPAPGCLRDEGGIRQTLNICFQRAPPTHSGLADFRGSRLNSGKPAATALFSRGPHFEGR
ncbi:hypothetical protein MRX96_019039 [Rhipicephalus microplus]